MPSRYEASVDPDAPNNAHAFMLQMVGWNQRVLELGAAAGHLTRALVGQSCRVTAIEYDLDAAGDLKEIADEVIAGDLNDPHVFAQLPEQFDVILAGDVLEHLLAPQQVLDRASHLLVPGGRVVVSLPHVAHVDLRLSLLQGRFDYNWFGLLDETHVRFFTLKTIREMVHRSGFVIIDLQRVRIPAFETEIDVDRSSVTTAVLDAALSDPEAETYQFVFTAVRDDGNYQTSRLAERAMELQDELHRVRIGRRASEIAAESAQREELTRTAHVRDCLEEECRRRVQLDSEINALVQTKTFRYTRPLRQCYERLRRLAGVHE
jgi:2-polyprenyl-3-methyl-5-hydroxy-6-metoxy-1,4-benzoquinol methylase